MRRLVVHEKIISREDGKTFANRTKPIFFTKEHEEIRPLTGMPKHALDVLRKLKGEN